MSNFSDNMASVASEMDDFFGDDVSVTPKGGTAASITGRLGPERVDENVDDRGRTRHVTRLFSFEPSNGPDARFVGGQLTLADGTVYRVEGVDSRTASRIVLKLTRRVVSEQHGQDYRVMR